MAGNLRGRIYWWLRGSKTGTRVLAVLSVVSWPFRRVVEVVLLGLVLGVIGILRLLGPERAANFTGKAARLLAPLVPANRVARANLKAAFPEKTDNEIEALLGDVCENLGRVAGEFAHLEAIWDYDADTETGKRIEIPPQTIERFIRLRDDGKPAILFTAHLGNWELAGVAAAAQGLDTAVVYRPPNSPAFERIIERTRSKVMAELIASRKQSIFSMVKVLEQGRHLGMLVDQHFMSGIPAVFFGRRTQSHPLVGRLSRHIDCPIHGVRVIRLPGTRFRLELTDEIKLPRGADGKVDAAGATQKVMSIVEEWVREHPEQWLWHHRRWKS
jgi:KDO2-lipid IV(A) lauroyltransferase